MTRTMLEDWKHELELLELQELVLLEQREELDSRLREISSKIANIEYQIGRGK